MEKTTSERQNWLGLKTGALAAQLDPQTIEGQLLFLKDDQCVFGYKDSYGRELWKYLSAETLRQAFSQLPVDTGWLPKRVVRWGISDNEEWVVLFIPAGKYPLVILEEGRVSGLESQETSDSNTLQFTPLPALIFAGKASNYYLWAVKDKSFNPVGKLFAAPLPNLAEDGRICYGNTRPPKAGTTTIHTAWQVFIQSAFNQHHIQGKCRSTPGDIREFLHRLSGESKFPQRELVGYKSPTGKEVTVDQAVTALLLKS